MLLDSLWLSRGLNRRLLRCPRNMKPLETQEQFEILIGRGDHGVPPPPGTTIVYFTATWCGACRRLNLDSLVAALPSVNFLKCDVDMNTYTPGYCGVRAIPTFILIHNGNICDSYQNNDTAKVLAWIQATMEKLN